MVTHQSALTPISDFFPSSEVATTWQTDSTAYKLKPRSFHKSTYLRVHPVDFHSSVNHAWQSAKSWFSCRICSHIFWLFRTYILSSTQTIPSSSYAWLSFFSNSFTTSCFLVLFFHIFSSNVVSSTTWFFYIIIMFAVICLLVYISSLSIWMFLLSSLVST